MHTRSRFKQSSYSRIRKMRGAHEYIWIIYRFWVPRIESSLKVGVGSGLIGRPAFAFRVGLFPSD